MRDDVHATAPVSRLNILAAVLGGALEWFDLIVYGFFATTIAKLFFPKGDDFVALLLSLGTFSVSFVARPIGAIVIGRFADTAGRRASLVLTSVLMMAGTAMIAVTPTYSEIGVLAPVCLLAARLMQGFSAGGEFGGATAFLAEQSPTRKAFYSSWQFSSQGAATILAAAFGLLAAHLGPPSAAAWRLPFIFGLAMGPVVAFIRWRVGETPEFKAAQAAPGMPRRDSAAQVTSAITRMLAGFGAVLIATVCMYFIVFLPTFAQTALHLDASIGLAAALEAGLIICFAPPVFGAIADRRGLLPGSFVSVGLLVVTPPALFPWLVSSPSFAKVLVLQAVLSLLSAVYFGSLPALLAVIFPVRIRTAGVSISYNMAVVLAGGFSPLFLTLLIRSTGSQASPGLYISGAALLSLGALFYIKSRLWVGDRRPTHA